MATRKAQNKKNKSKLRAPDDDGPSAEEKKRKNFLSKFFVAMFVIPGLCGALITIWGYFAPPYTTISLSDSKQLKNVFFSGQPWLLTCEPYKNQEVNSVFAGLSSTGSGKYKLAVINCDLPMPSSGKTVIERFKLNKQKKYSRTNLAFTVANGQKPKIVPSFYFKTGTKKKPADVGIQIKNLDKYVTDKVNVKYGKIKNGAQLTKSCLSKTSSAIVLIEGEASIATKSQIERLAQTYRTLWFCVVDRTMYKFSLEDVFPEQLTGTVEEGEAKLLIFRKKKRKKLSGDDTDSTTKDKKGKDVLMARPFNGLLSSSGINTFIEKTTDKNDGLLLMQALRKKPTLRYKKSKSRKKKEKAKKKRKDKRKKKKSKNKKKTTPKKKKPEPPKPKPPSNEPELDEHGNPTKAQLEREQQRRMRMDQQAQQHYAQAADEEDEEEEDEEEDDVDENEDEEDDDVEEVYEEDEQENEDDVDDEDTIEL